MDRVKEQTRPTLIVNSRRSRRAFAMSLGCPMRNSCKLPLLPNSSVRWFNARLTTMGSTNGASVLSDLSLRSTRSYLES